jgi:hypothetical protein
MLRADTFLGVWIICCGLCVGMQALAQEGAPPEIGVRLEQPSGPTLQCERVECNCASMPETSGRDIVFRRDASPDCVRVDCVCVQPEPQEPHRDALGVDRRAQRERQRQFESPAVGGFLVSRGDLGLVIDLGWPYLNLGFSYGVNDAVELGVGYRGLWSMSSTGYLSLKVRLSQNRTRRSAVSLNWLGGYTYVSPGDHDYRTSLAAGDSVFSDILFSASIGRGRHIIFLDAGVHLGWVQSQEPCEYDDWGYYDCYDRVFPDGEAGVLVAAIFDIGWAVRLRPQWSLSVALGFNAFVNSEEMPGYGTVKLGFSFDIQTSRREGGS